MTQGIWIYPVDEDRRRPRSKKEVKDLVMLGDESVSAEATSMFGDEYSGPVFDMPITKTITFCGPDPHTNRKFYGVISWRGETLVVT